MNKNIDNYKKKLNRIINTFKLIGIAILILGILVSIVQFSINRSKEKNQNASLNSGFVVNIEDKSIYYEAENNITAKISDYEAENIYRIQVNLNEKNIYEKNNIAQEEIISLKFEKEGENIINFLVFANDEEKYNITYTIYYIKPYKNQFLEEITNKGIQVQYRVNNTYEDYKTSLKMIKTLGVKNLRSDIFRYSVVNSKNEYDFSYYDSWIKEATDAGLSILIEFNGFVKKINNDEMFNKYKDFVYQIMNRYPQISSFEILNEPNIQTDSYKTDEDIENYVKLVEMARKIAKDTNNEKIIISGALANLYKSTDTKISTEEFFIKFLEKKGYNYSNAYSYHPYDGNNINIQNKNLNEDLGKYKKMFNQNGGFIKQYITEYGISIFNGKTEKDQANKLIQQTTLMDKYGVDFSSIYNFWDTGIDSTNAIRNYGIVRNDYTPKLSFYAMKNYYTNTNGSEYIGYISGNEGLEAHIYDKDGKPLIIAWSDNKDKTFNFPLGTMTAKDVYGNTITPDSNGTVQITTSPIYIYNITTSCYYQAISNVILTKYNTFLSDYSNEITKIPNLKTEIESLKNKISNISNITTLNESEAIDLMKKHYDLGNKILNEKSNGTIQIEYIKISSMLDYLDDIGDTYEDLVTVSAKNRNTNLTETKNLIDEVNQIINNNLDIEIIYPTKILEFSKDFYDKSSYINSVQEENDIKTGLIVSKNLHANLLANWAKSFAEIYVNQVINQYITEHPVNITYSNTNLTNQDVKATIQTTGDIKILNNSGSKEYTFKENGTFTFEYQIKGRTMAITATVSNIDKTAPLITGIQNDKLYIDSVTPKITDVNLENVQLYKNTALIPTYRANSTISEEGNYKLIATDKAGNKTEITFYISRIPASIKYSSTDMTNKNVTATIVSNFSLKVTNNSNSNTYIFKQNGEFTFKYTIKGTDLELKATVNNIDKKAPIISGVNPNKIYTSSVIPTVSDENLDKVELYKEEDKVYDYILGNEVKEEGLYKIIATDKAGNTTTTKFGLIERTDTSYKIKNNMILNIKDNTNKSEFSKKIKIGAEYQVLRNGNPISNSDIVATGDILKTTNGNEYTLIVAGDINKDGQLNIKDLVKLRKHLLQIRTLTGIELEAADCNVDGEKINLKDLARMRLLILLKDII